MFVRAAILAATMAAVCASAATKDEDLDKDSGQAFGNNQITWQMFNAGGPAVAFAVSAQAVFFANGTDVVGTIDATKAGVKKAFTLPAGFSAEGVCTIAWDGKTAWIGGKSGIAKYTAGKFELVNKSNGLPDGEVRKIRLADDGRVWVASSGGVAVFANGSWKTFTITDGLPSNDIRDISFSKDGDVWVATGKGVAQYHGQAWSVQGEAQGLSSGDVHAIAVDKRNGDVWVACGDADVCGLQGGKWNAFSDIQKGIRTILIDTQSRIWFGHDAGIIKFNGDEWESDGKKLGVPATSVYDTWISRNGDLYFGTEKGVIHLKNPYPF